MTLQSSGKISILDIVNEFGCAKNLNACAVAAGLSTTNIKMSSFYGRSANRYYTLTGGTNVNLATWLSSQNAPTGKHIIVTVTGNIGSTSTSSYALATGNISKYTSVQLVNNSGVYIVGQGGYGTPGVAGGTARRGGNGGPSLNVTSPILVSNYGVIGGGGGGGGGSGGTIYYEDNSPDEISYGGSGGGGAGYLSGSGYPAGGISLGGNPAGDGGNGGNLGSNGKSGVNGDIYGGKFDEVGKGGDGGTAGKAIVGIGNISWVVVGDIVGKTQ